MLVKDFTQLIYFRSVAQLENITRAAAELHISQPNLSVSIKRIENTLGVALFERKNGRLSLNDYGRLYLSAVNQAIQIMEDAEQNLHALQSPGRGNKLSIGSSMRGYLADLTSTYLRDHPEADLRISQNVLPVESVLAQLADDRLDFALIPSDNLSSAFEWSKVIDCPVALLLSTKHPLACSTKLDADAVAQERFVCNNTAIGASATQKLCEQAGFEPKIIFDSTDSNTIGKMIDDENCLALISVYDLMCLENESRADVTARLIAGCSLHIPLGLAKKRDAHLNSDVADFYTYALAFLSDLDNRIARFWARYRNSL